MKHCIVNTTDKQIIEKLSAEGYVCHSVIESNRVSQPICAHSDVLYRKLNSNTILLSGCQKKNQRLLESSGYNCVFFDKITPGYSTECYLNFIINNKYIIRNAKTAINLEEQYRTDRIIINVKQGYTSCSTLCVTEDAYITDDDNIYKTLTKHNIDCLKISKGGIELPGYDYGFIGGASVKLGNDKILFFGDFADNKEKESVINFLNKYKIKALFIENKKLTDLGSALIL